MIGCVLDEDPIGSTCHTQLTYLVFDINIHLIQNTAKISLGRSCVWPMIAIVIMIMTATMIMTAMASVLSLSLLICYCNVSINSF